MIATDGEMSAPGLFKRLMIVVYDSLLLLAILFVATACLLPFTGGEAVPVGPLARPLYLFYLLTVSFAFYGWFWTHGGQTLGMKAWKVKVYTLDGATVGWGRALLRFLLAILSWVFFGLGFLWILFRSDSATWHDLGSKTRLLKCSI